MRYLLFALLCFLITSNSSGQGFTNKEEAKNLITNGIKEGKWIEYINGLGGYCKDANTATFYRLINYKAGNPLGKVREYYLNGELVRESLYKNDSLIRIVNYHQEDGITLTDTTFMDTVNVFAKNEFYTNGNATEYPYIDGKQTGIEKVYYQKGRLRSEIPYSDGNLNGVLKEYYATGHIKEETPYTQGQRNGVDKSYFENGKLSFEYPYANDITDGLVKFYWENGNLKAECPYTRGEINGTWKIYYQDGNLEFIKPYSHNVENGIEQNYAEDGKLLSETTYTNGVKAKTKENDGSGNSLNH